MAAKPYKNHNQFTIRNQSTTSDSRKAKEATNEEYAQEYECEDDEFLFYWLIKISKQGGMLELCFDILNLDLF